MQCQAYADEKGLTFISFNEQSVYQQMDYQIAVDNCDDGHPNIWGAVKVTDYMGKVLSEEFGLERKTQSQWEDTREDYAFIMDKCSLDHTGDIDTYLAALNHEQYTVVIGLPRMNLRLPCGNLRWKSSDSLACPRTWPDRKGVIIWLFYQTVKCYSKKLPLSRLSIGEQFGTRTYRCMHSAPGMNGEMGWLLSGLARKNFPRTRADSMSSFIIIRPARLWTVCGLIPVRRRIAWDGNKHEIV